MKNTKKFLVLLLTLAMVIGMVASCGGGGGGESDKNTLVIGYSPFSSKFSPFFAETQYDKDAADMTTLYLFGSDRTGAVVEKGIEGTTTEYNGTEYTYYGPADMDITENADGTVYYDITMRDDLVFSDGEPITIDDVIFTMYALCDPTYDGSTTLFAVPIEGMDAYRSGMSTLSAYLAQLGEDNTDFTNVTEEQSKAFWDAVNDGGVKFAQGIIDYLVEAGANTKEDSVAKCAANWGFELEESATVKDFFLAIAEKYGWNFSAMAVEAGNADIADCIPEDVMAYSTTGVTFGESAPNITGIQKTGDYSMRIVLTKVDAASIYQVGVPICPLHYYGDKEAYDYDNNNFGFPKGDLSSLRAKTTEPMGAGPYKFVKFDNGTINFEANENYFKGEPKTKYVNFLETQEADKLNGVTTGTIDITDPSFSKDTADAISKENGGELNGDKIVVSLVDNLGYGYVGVNANRVKVGDDPASEQSKNLRKGFATVLSVYRDVAIESYYGDAATVINYPISNTSWAAPQATDDGYQIAFSTDVDGNPIYTSDMSADEKYAAALQAALGYFEAAGYTVTDGKVTAAPEGASMEYELLIPGDGAGDHPSFMLVSEASKAFETIGIKLIVTDLTDSSQLWTGMEANQVDMWCAAWQATPDPDMYQIYFSGMDGQAAGGSNYTYSISDPELNQLILDGRSSLDQAYRKTVYKSCLDIIVDWAVEIPVYQRQNCYIFSPERVNMDTVTPDITTFYGWMAEIENLELN